MTNSESMRSSSIIKTFFRIFGLITCLAIGTLAKAQDPFSSSEESFLPVEEAYLVKPKLDGNEVTFEWIAADGYYLYRHQFSLTANSPTALEELDLRIPEGLRKYDEIFEKELEVYYGTIEIAATLPSFEGPFELQLSSQGCADAGLCYPPRTQYFSVIDGVITETPTSTVIKESTEPQGSSPNPSTLKTGALPSDGSTSLFLVLLGAVLGGMILNLMPCVFPVLSLKALHLASGSPAQHRINGWAYTAGVSLSFVAVGIIIIAAKSAGTTLGWGFQLQQPVFVAALIYLFFVLSMNLFGLFEIGTSWMGIGNSLTQGDGIAPSFFTGVLAAVVASPCTAPFMATAIGYTLTQGNAVTLLVFISLGLGMALPYLILSHSPQVAQKLPAPGPWMDTFKQFLAFPLLFTCAWLLVVLGNQTSAYTASLLVAGTICIAMAFWLLRKQPRSSLRWFCRVCAVVLFGLAAQIAMDTKSNNIDNSDIVWQPYTPETLEQLRASKTAVFIDLTADWCITCKINEKVAINVEEIKQFAEQNNIALLQGDWTKPDAEITALLHQFGRNGVPLYLMYDNKGSTQPEILPQILTPSIVKNAMLKAVSQH